MGSVVVIHKDRRCIQRVIIKVRHNTCFKDVLSIDLSIAVASYCNEVKLTVIWYTPPHHDWASSERNSFYDVTLSISSVRLSPLRALCHLSRATRSDFLRINELSSMRPNSIDDLFGTILNGKLCVFVLVNMCLQVFLNDSQQISDIFGLFLQIATDGAITVFSKQYYWRTDFV
jgi:hypothetical protein